VEIIPLKYIHFNYMPSEHLIEFLSVVFGLIASIFITVEGMSKFVKIIIIVVIARHKKLHKKITNLINKNLKK
jgi:hypothetical protein